MISRGQKKKISISPPKLANNKKKSKSKSKSKQKTKKISAQDFLQAFIDLQNTNCSTNRKRGITTRDISSALTIATPILQKTISSTKIRSRSSFSQYRKKCSNPLKQPLKLNLCEVITEQDKVQYTEKSARSHIDKNQQLSKNNIKSEVNFVNKKLKFNLNTCAIKIQRAWRNYQTYKTVHKAYLRQKKTMEENKVFDIQNKLKQSDFQTTLKIKKQHITNKDRRKQYQLNRTSKLIHQRFKSKGAKDASYDQKSSPINCFNEESFDLSLKSSTDPENLVIQKIKQQQAERFNQVINLIEKQCKKKTKQELLNDLILKFQENKLKVEKQMNKQLQCIHFDDSKSEDSITSSIKGKISQQMLSQNYENINLRDLQSNNSSICFEYDSMAQDFSQFKIFDKTLKIMKAEKSYKLEQIDSSLNKNNLQNEQAMRKKQLIYAKYDKEIKQIQKNKKQFLFSLTQLKKSAIKYQKSAFFNSSSLTRLRKSYSAGNTVLKSALRQIAIQQFSQIGERLFLINDQNEKDQIKRLQPIFQHLKPLTNTPILSLSSPRSSQSENKQSAQQKIMQKNNTQVMKQYSEDVQQLIQKQLIDEFVRSAFIEDSLYNYFRPYVEQIYQFSKISDKTIIEFVQTIEQYFSDEKTMLRRVNQKINPSSQEILKIIRDLNYQIDQYELIVPQQCFKKYRAHIQKTYEQMNNKMTVNKIQLETKLYDKQLAQKILRIESQKKQKMKKYRNFQRDLKIMYMKSVFNCINQFLIQTKSSNAYMNARSSLGPGELTLALKQYNQLYDKKEYKKLLSQIQTKLGKTIGQKCSIPSFQNYQDIELFQKQVMKQIQIESNENEFKWVNYMDEVLQIWQDLSTSIVNIIIQESCTDILTIFK